MTQYVEFDMPAQTNNEGISLVKSTFPHALFTPRAAALNRLFFLQTDRSILQGDGTFRADLFFRLNVFPIHLPPLRERRDDIPLLVNHFLNHYRHKHACAVRGFTQAAVRALLNYDFPGNITSAR